MPEQTTCTVKEVAETIGISPSRISQMIRGYVRSDGTIVDPELVEGKDYLYEVREFKGKSRTTRRVVPVLTNQGVESVKRVTERAPGRKSEGTPRTSN